nr:dual specificity protein phosphatase 22 isoform X4 [Cavia porcellus]
MLQLACGRLEGDPKPESEDTSELLSQQGRGFPGDRRRLRHSGGHVHPGGDPRPAEPVTCTPRGRPGLPRSCLACTSATSKGVKYLCIPAADSPSQNLTRHFKESIKFIHECRLQGEGCLVHCLAGVSRSVTLVIAYIMTVTDFGWEDALHTVRAGRSCANPNLGFQRQLQEFEQHEVHQIQLPQSEGQQEDTFLPASVVSP